MADRSLLETESQLIERLSAPDQAVSNAVAQLDGDILLLGVAGKMGPTLAEMLVRAGARRVIGVSRFSDSAQQDYLEKVGVRTIKADLLDEDALARLPQAHWVLFLAGFKFGATGNEPMTWTMNAYLPARVVQRFPRSHIVYVSSGNVYAYSPVIGRGAPEEGELGPVGEYAQSRLGGERLAWAMAQRQGTPLLIARLFYATELRYGIVHDLAWKVQRGEIIDVSMGHVNQIWQGDANAYLARLFPRCATPPAVINLTGPQVLSVRDIAARLGEELGTVPVFAGLESETALLGDASRLVAECGPPATAIDQVVRWMAHWVKIAGPSLGKPTKYESRSGKF